MPLRIARARHGTAHAELLAARVARGRRDPARFRVPEGYQRLHPGVFAPRWR